MWWEKLRRQVKLLEDLCSYSQKNNKFKFPMSSIKLKAIYIMVYFDGSNFDFLQRQFFPHLREIDKFSSYELDILQCVNEELVLIEKNCFGDISSELHDQWTLQTQKILSAFDQASINRILLRAAELEYWLSYIKL